MKLSEIKEHLSTAEAVNFRLADGSYVPEHFHVTEVGEVQKKFIDCGGTVRAETVVNFQLWDANDYDHRLKPAKLLNIIKLSEEVLNIGDHEIEVEYQGDTIGKYNLGHDGTDFMLKAKKTDCLAQDSCGVPKEEASKEEEASCCTPGGGCC
ncbi:MAG: hypothetical protein BM557_10410 [Flavobacterium sp. MedPE-SWcel]|uniref:DUF6428 family protein n=1 Tax=uncultured Flavobacterium sp. TaxID=165435 RepID=UPI0009168714|nr:DUF6428 family protein [uncultured Flavobacterium sp.]OIQ16275.1 MAG: hypothetical protein BM557_10410 [Flavobacterium sp. MedPE-SWcel]